MVLKTAPKFIYFSSRKTYISSLLRKKDFHRKNNYLISTIRNSIFNRKNKTNSIKLVVCITLTLQTRASSYCKSLMALFFESSTSYELAKNINKKIEKLCWNNYAEHFYEVFEYSDTLYTLYTLYNSKFQAKKV